MLTKEEMFDKAKNRAENRTLCTHQEYINMLVKLLIDEIDEHKKQIELQKEEIQTLIKFMGKEQYIRFKNRGLNY